MPPDEMPRKPKAVDKKVMSQTSALRQEAQPPTDRVRMPGTRKEDWIANQLRRVYDDALNESIPKEMLDLLNALDESNPEGGERE